MAMDIRMTDVPFSRDPDHEARVFINDGGKLRQTDLTTIAKYSELYELIIGAHTTAMDEITQQLETGQLGMTEAFDSYNAQLTATHTNLTNALNTLKAEVETDMTESKADALGTYATLKSEYTKAFEDNNAALEETRKSIDAQIQTGKDAIGVQYQTSADDIAMKSSSAVSQLTQLYNNSAASLETTKNNLAASLTTQHTTIKSDLNSTHATLKADLNSAHATNKSEIQQIISDGQADIQAIIENIGDLQDAVTAMDTLKNSINTHLSASNPHGISKSTVGLSNVPNVTTNDQTPTFTVASTRANITSGEKLSVMLGKIAKFFTDLKTVAFTGSYNDLSNKPTIPTVPTKVSAFENDSSFLTSTGNASNVTAQFTGYDTENSPSAFISMDYSFVTPGSTLSSILGVVASAVRNVRRLVKMTGSTDISDVGDGTVTGAISTLKKSVADGKQLLVDTIGDSAEEWASRDCDEYVSGLTNESSFQEIANYIYDLADVTANYNCGVGRDAGEYTGKQNYSPTIYTAHIDQQNLPAGGYYMVGFTPMYPTKPNYLYIVEIPTKFNSVWENHAIINRDFIDSAINIYNGTTLMLTVGIDHEEYLYVTNYGLNTDRYEIRFTLIEWEEDHPNSEDWGSYDDIIEEGSIE